MRKPSKSKPRSSVPQPPDEVAPTPPENENSRLIDGVQFVPPSVAPEAIPGLLERFDALSVGKGPSRSALSYSPEELEAMSPEEVWVIMQGMTPVEFLTYVYRQPFINMSHRISAAARVAEFIHRAKPRALVGANGEPLVPGVLSGSVVALGALGQVNLKKLSDEEIDTLSHLLGKASDSEVPAHADLAQGNSTAADAVQGEDGPSTKTPRQQRVSKRAGKVLRGHATPNGRRSSTKGKGK